MVNSKERFLKAYSNLPENLRGEIIVVVDKKPYSWDAVYFEVKENTVLSKKLLKTLCRIDII
ncbi:MAG: hypothetical protein KKG60_01770 [Nanoarchaeota archaeon]|nr:hypothetical protein [Nanoarchaeota archaeon]